VALDVHRRPTTIVAWGSSPAKCGDVWQRGHGRRSGGPAAARAWLAKRLPSGGYRRRGYDRRSGGPMSVGWRRGHDRWRGVPAAVICRREPLSMERRPSGGAGTTTGCDGTEAGRSDDLMASSRCCLDAACPAAVTDERRRLKTGSGPGYVGSDDGSDWCDTHRFCVGVREPVCSSSSSVEKKHQQLLKGK
jgi:hypothetical protein